MNGVGARLLMPLVPLGTSGPHLVPDPGWAEAVDGAAECCLLLDATARIAAASTTAVETLGLRPDAIGARFSDVVAAVDFTSGAAPDREQERTLPPLRALSNGGLSRGLVRLRTATDALVTFDVVAVPLARQVGVLAFFVRV